MRFLFFFFFFFCKMNACTCCRVSQPFSGILRRVWVRTVDFQENHADAQGRYRLNDQDPE
jgi:hypothetical protein